MSPMDALHGIPHVLWTTSWQAGLMAGAAWLACRQWPRMPANLRVALWWLVSLKFVVGLMWTQPIVLPVLPASFGSHAIQGPAAGRDVIRSDASPNSDGLRRPGGAARDHGGLTALALVAAACWLIGIALQGVLLLYQLARTRGLVARSQPVEGDAAELFDDLVDRLEIRASRPRLRVSTEIATPQVTGLVRPVVLLPVSTLESFTTRELTLTLCHELMHVQRFDLWHGWMPSIAARAFFFHPLARLAAREYAIAREAACDARVLAFTQAPAYDYGRLLLRLGVTAREAAPAAAGASPTLRTLKRRLLMLHDASLHAHRLSPRWWALALAAGLLVVPMRPTAATRAGETVMRSADARPAVEWRQRTANPHESPQDDQGESWVFLRGGDDNTSMHGSDMDLAEARRLRANPSERLIWFKQNGRAYVIRDPRMLDNAEALFVPQHELDKAQRGLESRQMVFSDRQTALAKTQEALAAQARAYDTETNLRLAEARREQVRKEQDALAVEQRALGEHQAALGEEQAALGRQMGEMRRAIWWEMRPLFDSAIAAGLATPVK